MDVYVTEEGGAGITWYQVWVDGVVYETMHLRTGPRLTWSQMADIAKGYREALEDA